MSCRQHILRDREKLPTIQHYFGSEDKDNITKQDIVQVPFDGSESWNGNLTAEHEKNTSSLSMKSVQNDLMRVSV